MTFESVHAGKDRTLSKRVDEICKEFSVDESDLSKLTYYFIDSMKAGLEPLSENQDETPSKRMAMIPSFITDKPNGTETGLFLAADLGGTNFRVCSVELHGDHTFSIQQLKSPIPEELHGGEGVTSHDLFSFLARRTVVFLKKHHDDLLKDEQSGPLKLGFTFSYPIEQKDLHSGTLLRWTKGFNIPDTVGKDVVELYQNELNDQALSSSVKVVALTNDTVGTFLSHCYKSGDAVTSLSGEISDPIIGCIFGTGTNGCYLEEIDNIKKLPQGLRDKFRKEGKTHMIINIEWGSFDNQLKVLPVTKYDTDIDQKYSSIPGYHFEKRVSGMFMGELLRNVLVELHNEGLLFPHYKTYDQLPHRLRTPFELNSEVLSHVEIDDSTDLRETELCFNQALRLPTNNHERQQIQRIVRAISHRSAFLSAVPIAAIVIKTDALHKRLHGEVEVGCDGSVVEYYPGFRSMLRDALALSPLSPDGERKVHIKIAKDGSGVGAALCALVA